MSTSLRSVLSLEHFYSILLEEEKRKTFSKRLFVFQSRVSRHSLPLFMSPAHASLPIPPSTAKKVGT